ncbi:putative GTP-binding protein EngB [Blattabacterium sp. (Nauphoeta cinerea)]|uniref:ribosome biogenesis GTP-binding protein YihA/YsxC n=1 Tax=Blattabacterium sp. (Nauphoeta cinerea) TaxID=1316444 RepID=UPI0003B03868|nr:ribosome biogenesis GTP-binding protein YihA/YsxC [Blattabacterium sp. (Nauphoeta cinerea)]AGW85863.1 putative GTP-binding protein EngB [Blattabacterium sp. (Nauphoeta cinerea)]
MKIFSVKFKGSLKNINQLLIHNFPEYAFVGRSNVGKSSLINCITKKKIAKVSSYPGRTQCINYFLINHKWYLIDLPGYGFFSVKTDKQKTQKLITDYIFYQKNIVFLFLLIDCRLFIQKIDLNFIQKLNNTKIRFCIVFTKTDKLKNHRFIDENISSYIKEIKKNGCFIPTWFKVSVKNEYGINDIIQHIKKLNDFYQSYTYKRKLIIPNS